MNRLLVSSGGKLGFVFQPIIHCSSAGKRDPRKEKELALRSSARRLVRSLTHVSLLLASAAAIADNPPSPHTNRRLGETRWTACIRVSRVSCERRCRGRTFKASSEAARAQSCNAIHGSPIPVTARFSDGSGMPTVPDGSPAMPRGIDHQVPPGRRR